MGHTKIIIFSSASMLKCVRMQILATRAQFFLGDIDDTIVKFLSV